jgi:inosose dehydratase
VEGLKKYGKRVWHFHFKDYQPEFGQQGIKEGWDYFKSVSAGVFCELGQGDVDFPLLLAELDRIGYEGWGVVEQDVLPGMGQPKESAQRNRDYLARIGLEPHVVKA